MIHGRSYIPLDAIKENFNGFKREGSFVNRQSLGAVQTRIFDWFTENGEAIFLVIGIGSLVLALGVGLGLLISWLRENVKRRRGGEGGGGVEAC